ncbi:MAG: putative RNA-binding protein, TRAM domain family [Candidatus Nanosalina sp. J07AB43]|nr:MAG: putative RNA-binding protein, TRAM domain family [Candidatus Nanosalina sp. J07AB43]
MCQQIFADMVNLPMPEDSELDDEDFDAQFDQNPVEEETAEETQPEEETESEPEPETEEPSQDEEDEELDKPVSEGEITEVEIEDLGSKGDGIARKEGFVIFVPGGEVDETYEIEVTSVGRKFAFGEINE